MKMQTVLIVEDERHIADGIKLNLELDNYQAEVCASGDLADDLLKKERYDLVILDVMLPGINGFEVCRRMRERDDRTPVLFLTARRQPEDRVRGLDIGGDDYLQKPFHLKELLSRVHAILRRRAWSTAAEDVEEVAIGPASVNLKTMTGTGPRGEFTLTRRENIILKLLVERRGEPVSRADILDRAWGKSSYPTDRTVDNFIVRLRQYIEDDPAKPENIQTIRGIGYKLI